MQFTYGLCGPLRLSPRDAVFTDKMYNIGFTVFRQGKKVFPLNLFQTLSFAHLFGFFNCIQVSLHPRHLRPQPRAHAPGISLIQRHISFFPLLNTFQPPLSCPPPFASSPPSASPSSPPSRGTHTTRSPSYSEHRYLGSTGACTPSWQSTWTWW